MTVVTALVKLGLSPTRGQARRWIAQGAVWVDETHVVMDCEIAPGRHTVRVGKSKIAEHIFGGPMKAPWVVHFPFQGTTFVEYEGRKVGHLARMEVLYNLDGRPRLLMEVHAPCVELVVELMEEKALGERALKSQAKAIVKDFLGEVFATSCTHPKCRPEFDEEKAKHMHPAQIQKTFPRFQGVCPDCGQEIIKYASREHQYYGDW